MSNGVSQIFICIDLHPLAPQEHIVPLAQRVIDDLHASLPAGEKEKVRYPGERTMRLREKHQIHGILVDPTV
jgi:LDH2 family malate/lactate/ureidoglycolate dehydrogenase